MLHRIKPLCLSFSVLLLCACASSVPNEKGLREEAARAAAQQGGRSAAQALAQVETDIGTAKQQGMLFYAPRHMRLAIDALETARKMQRGNMAEKPLLETVLTAETALKRAREVEKKVLTILQPSLQWHAELVLLNTHKSLPDDYLNSIADLNELIDDIESGKPDVAQRDQRDHLKTLQELEIATHLLQQLQRARDALQEAEKLDSDDNTPVSLTAAQQAISAAEQQIKQQPRQFEPMQKLSSLAWQEAQHVLALNQQMTQIKNELHVKSAEGETFEQLLLTQEKWLAPSFAALSISPPKYLTLQAQHAQLAQLITLQKNNQPVSLPVPAHIDLRYPSQALTIERVLPSNYSTWLSASSLATTLQPTPPAQVQSLSAPEPKAQEVTPAANHDEDELQKAIAEETNKK